MMVSWTELRRGSERLWFVVFFFERSQINSIFTESTNTDKERENSSLFIDLWAIVSN